MAASEYYHQIPAGNGAGPNPSLASRPHNLSPQPSHFYPQAPPTSNPQPQQAPPPPPYQPVEVPAEKPYRPIDQQCQRNSFSHPQRPPAQVWNAPYNQITPVPHNQDYYPFYPQDPPKHSQYPPQSMYQNPPPHLRPYHAYSSTPNLAQGYSSDPEPRRRRRSRNKSPSRSRAADGFLGAAGGGLIGDLIFPGLGTLGGAVAGYFGGKDYGKHRERRESMNREEQRLWEAKYGKRRHIIDESKDIMNVDTSLPMHFSSGMINFHVRGKRKRRECPPANTSPSSSNPRSRGRRMMAASELGNKKARRSTPASGLRAKAKSWLERLPVELLEQIFLHALEFNMVHALPSLRKSLSCEPIYKVLILFAFFEDDEQHPVEEKHFDPATYQLLGRDEHMRLQKNVLESRWCTLSRVTQCLPVLKRLTIVQQWHSDRDKDIEAARALGIQDRVGPQQQPPSSLPPLDDMAAVLSYYSPAHMDKKFWNPVDFDVALTNYGIHRVFLNVYTLPYRILNPMTWHKIPQTNNENCDPLEFLTLLWHGIMNNTTSQPISPANPAAVLLGIETAIRERNGQVLNLLMVIHSEAAGFDNTDEEENLSYNIPVTLLHLGTRQGADSESILRLLLKSRVRNGWIPKDDVVLTRWAIAADEAGSAFARWLREAMVADDPLEMFNFLMES